MKIHGQHVIPARPERVFEALADPAVLQRSFGSCEEMKKSGANEYTARLNIGVASVKGRYTGTVRILEQQPPARFVLQVEGHGAAGFVRGTVQIALTPLAGASRLEYTAEVQVGGLIVAVGSRLIEVSAKRLADEFFQRFSQIMEQCPEPGKPPARS